jgi:RNA polymerase sigma-70 factor (ECF subfamily)
MWSGGFERHDNLMAPPMQPALAPSVHLPAEGGTPAKHFCDTRPDVIEVGLRPLTLSRVAVGRDRAEVCTRVPANAHDREVAARLVAGDESALRSAYHAHSRAVFGLAMRVLGNDALAEEVTQDVFVRLWEQPDRFDPERGALRSFLLATTHSRAVERVRAEDSIRRRQQFAQREPIVPASDDPGHGLVVRDIQQAVRRALDTLPSDQRRAIEMAYYDGMSYRDVADALAEPEGTVKYRIRTGMQKMRAALQAVEVAP